MLIVRDEGLRVQKTWPHRRDIPWYRILATDVIPGFWNLELELNSGERVELPPVPTSTRSTRTSSATAPPSTPDPFSVGRAGRSEVSGAGQMRASRPAQ